MTTVRRAPGAAAALLLLAVLAAPAARASDHNNIDAGRPLRFDDAETIAFGERDFEYGLSLGFGRGRAAGLGLTAEYLVGVALNTHVSVGIDASVGGRADNGNDTGLDIGGVGIGVLHNFNREYGGTPAFSLRGDVFLPTGRGGAHGADLRLRAILSRAHGPYGRLHLNADAVFAIDPGENERTFRPALTLGYSVPLGYPTRFDRTGLAEIGIRSGEERGTVVSGGVGLRQQVTPRAVIDAGIQSDLAGSRRAPRETLRLVAGYSTAF